MRLSLLAALLAGAGPALAGPWLPGPTTDPTDAVAQAPESDAPPIAVDLSAVRAALEDSVRRVLQDQADPVQAFAVPVAAAPDTTAAELRGLLDGSGAHTARLDAVLTRWILYKGESAVVEVQAVVRPDRQTTLLRLTVLSAPTTPAGPPVALPGGLGISWSRAEAAFSRALREGACERIPLTPDSLLQSVVPASFYATTEQARNAAGPARRTLCEIVGGGSWDRLELRASELHFNLYDKAGTLRGGLELRASTDGGPASFSYPLFKRLPDAP